MELNLKNKVVVVTGASKGIGRAIALAFAREGASVVICARGKVALEKVANEIAEAGAQILALPCDVTDTAQVGRVMEQVGKRFDRLDVLVNNAGGAGRFAPFLDLTDDDWRQAWNFNLMSMVWFTKAAVINLNKYLSNALAKEQILVNCICPGPVWSASWEGTAQEMSQRLGLSYEEAVRMLRAGDEPKIPLHRLAYPAKL